MGKRYTEQEISQIQALTNEGITDIEIAQRLGRTEDSIRNIRHRNKLRAQIKDSIETLRDTRKRLSRKIAKQQQDMTALQKRKQDVSQALQQDEIIFNIKLEEALRKMKHRTPELFYLTGQEQLIQLTAQIAGPFLKWLITE
ncbi:hypothetical protein ACFL0D_07790 [Thermoproteota archaeon]